MASGIKKPEGHGTVLGGRKVSCSSSSCWQARPDLGTQNSNAAALERSCNGQVLALGNLRFLVCKVTALSGLCELSRTGAHEGSRVAPGTQEASLCHRSVPFTFL